MKITLKDFFRSNRATKYQSHFLALMTGVSMVPFLTLAQTQKAQNEMDTKERSVERNSDSLPDDSALHVNSRLQRENENIKNELDALRSKMEAGQPKPNQGPQTKPPGSVLGASPTGNSRNTATDIATPENPSNKAAGAPLSGKMSDVGVAEKNSTQPHQTDAKVSTAKKGNRSARFSPAPSGNSNHREHFASPLQVFAVSQNTQAASQEGMTVLPTGSHVKARIVSGVEANAREPYPVLLQLDYAFTGPNKSKVNLSNCFMIAKARANMSTERVMMETESLSCVREDGEHFKREAKGYVAGEDNTFGATGTYISKQGQVLLAAVLASIAKNAGQAIADAQKTTSVVGADKAASATNITGSRAAFIGGSALVDGGAMVAQWYLEQAKELLPSIGVGSGQDVFVIMLDTIRVPTLQSETDD